VYPFGVAAEGRETAAALPHISALDGARGLAVAAVLLFHGGHLVGGYLGVDFFFTLSGFLITSLLLAESRRTGGVGLGGFWARRARRLLPALAVLMLGVTLYSWALARPAELSQIRGDAFATVGYVANWHDIFGHQSYWAIFSAPSPLTHTWSLAIEEQFYLVWPLIFVSILVLWKRAAPKVLLVICATLVIISSVLMIALYNPANTNRAYYGTDTRAAAILLGAALAAWLEIRGPARARASRLALEAVGLGAALVLAVAWARLDGQSSTLYHGGFLLCGLAATAVIAAAVHPEPGVVSRALSLGPLCALGLISYAVYLYHWPIDVVLNAQRVGYTGWPLFLTQTTVTIALAVASYFIIEQPIRRGALSSAYWRRLAPALAFAVVLVLTVSTVGARSPFRGQPKLPLAAAARAYETAPHGALRVLLVGNSAAYTLGPAFEKIRSDPPIAVFNAGIPACLFPPEVTAPPVIALGEKLRRDPCHPAWEADVVNVFRPDVVFWIVGDAANGGLKYQSRSVDQCKEPYNSIYRRSLSHEVARLRAYGAKVVITTEAYARFFGAPNLDRATDCDNQLRREVATETGVSLVDLFSFVCPHRQCRKTQNGVTLRPDGQHYEGPGGEIVANWLLRQVERRG
jgi:peptidoglycan/LPS O-acetylase OafA/YrhL